MMRHKASLAMILVMLLHSAASAQFGGVFSDAVRGATKSQPAAKPATDTATQTGCAAAGKTSRRSGVLGSVLGGVASRTINSSRLGIGVYVPIPDVAGILTDAFACKLDPKEQKQAANATVTATRGGAVGSTSTWTSDTRPGVTGSSTVAAREKLADGSTCMNVRDVAIVNGEETMVSKHMCRARGASGYTLAA